MLLDCVLLVLVLLSSSITSAASSFTASNTSSLQPPFLPLASAADPAGVSASTAPSHGASAGDESLPSSAALHECTYDRFLRQQARSAGAQTTLVAHVEYASQQRSSGRFLGTLSLPRSLRSAVPWEPVRIAIFTKDLDDPQLYCTTPGQRVTTAFDGELPCSSEDVLTEEKRDLLVRYILPEAARLHHERLSVQPVSRIVVDPRLGWSRFRPPVDHFSTGVPEADFVVYVSATPTVEGTIAWALTLQTDIAGRPLVGGTNISPRYIANSTKAVRAVAHELLHALGFSVAYFASTPTEAAASALVAVPSVRGKPYNVTGTRSTGAVAAARAHYGCPSMQYVELEDLGGSGSVGSHWKMRNAKDDLMSPVAGAMAYTALTIAAMEDLGFYKGNYDKAEPMAWGSQVGCDVFEKPCIENGSPLEPSMFCATADDVSLRCQSDRSALGRCRIRAYDHSLPWYMQYFSGPNIGGSAVWMDYCPYIVSSTSTGCATGDPDAMPGSVISPASRCLDAAHTASNGASVTVRVGFIRAFALCVDVNCSSTSHTYQIRVKGSDTFVDCPVGTTVSPRAQNSALFGSGELECPPYSEVCYENIGSAFGSDAATGRQGVLLSVLIGVAGMLTSVFL